MGEEGVVFLNIKNGQQKPRDTVNEKICRYFLQHFGNMFICFLAQKTNPLSCLYGKYEIQRLEGHWSKAYIAWRVRCRYPLRSYYFILLFCVGEKKQPRKGAGIFRSTQPVSAGMLELFYRPASVLSTA